MLHDGRDYSLHFSRQGSEDTIYQFGYNDSTQSYEYGYSSIDNPKLAGKPGDDTSSFALLHDGTTCRLYMHSKTNVTAMYQFSFDGRSYVYGHDSIP